MRPGNLFLQPISCKVQFAKMFKRRTTYAFGVFLIVAVFPLIAAVAPIVECPGREVNEIRRQAQHFELSLVFYHVAWCSESRAARNVFEEVASFYQPQVHFASVDCYHLACNCSQTHPLALGMGIPNKWPTLMVYYGHRITLQYYGEWSFAAVTRFLDRLYQPVVRVHSKAELKWLSKRSDAVVLGLFADAQGLEYRKFASAAVKWLETDPEGSFQFAVAFGTAANATSDSEQQLPRLLLISSRGVESYNSKADWNVNSIVMWVHTELKRSFAQLYAYSMPTNVLTHLHHGPVLAIFTNEFFHKHMESVTHSPSDLPTHGSALKFVQRHRLRSREHELTFRNELARLRYDMVARQHVQPTQCHVIEHSSRWNWQHYYVINAYLNELLCRVSPSCLSSATDARSTNRLLQLFERNKRLHGPRMNEPGRKIAIAKFLKQSTDYLWENSHSPRHNNSLSVVLLDRDKHRDFLDSQGIPTPIEKSLVSALIIDPSMESTFVFQEKFVYLALLRFVQNYYNHNKLTARKASSDFRPAPLSSQNSLHIHNFNREMLLQVLQKQNATTVLLLHSPECPFSALMSQALMQVSVMFDAAAAGIDIVRLNTQTNELPWELVMATTPTLIVFPRGRATESRVFPSYLKMDVRNVFGFILAQLEPVDQLKAVLSSCAKLPENALRLRKCLQFAKTLVTQHISTHLKLWQIYESERNSLLERLKAFKDINLDIKRSFSF